MQLQIIDVCAGDPRFAALCTELDAALDEAVGGRLQHSAYVPHNVMDPAAQAVLLMQGDVPVGCGALRALENGDAELKRVFVRKTCRCRGGGRKIVEALAGRAKAQSFRRMVLETGKPLADAMRLYKALGFAVIPNYGPYVGMDTSICMARAL